MKYNVGDRVRIKSIDWYNENKDNYGSIYAGNGFCFWKSMARLCGEIMKITSVKVDPEDSNKGYYFMENSEEKWTDEMIEGLVEEETKFGTASKPIEIKSNANCLTRERVDELATKIDKELPSGNQNVWELPDGYQFTDEDGNVINARKIVLEKKKKEYPKTYEECLKVLGYDDRETYCIFHTGADERLFEALYRLKVCRDAYWKLYGEEMGLGKPWEPDYNKVFGIIHQHGKIQKYNDFVGGSAILEFPTAEMRDAFKENFDPDLEICKEFL